MKIYTKTGDRGMTSLYSGKRVHKSDELIHATGTLDSCNSLLGLGISLLKREEKLTGLSELIELTRQLESIQIHLFCVGAHVSAPRNESSELKLQKTQLSSKPTEDLERWIDAWQERLPPLRHFILPGGHPTAAIFHHVRCECRHCERYLCPLFEQDKIEVQAIEFINRLSDYLFVIARLINHLMETEETAWLPEKKSSD